MSGQNRGEAGSAGRGGMLCYPGDAESAPPLSGVVQRWGGDGDSGGRGDVLRRETQGSALSISGSSGCRDRMAALAHTLHSRTQRDQTERQMPGLYSGKYEYLQHHWRGVTVPTNLRPQLTVRPRAQLLKRQPRRGNHPHATVLYSKCSSLTDTTADRQHAMGRRRLRGQ